MPLNVERTSPTTLKVTRRFAAPPQAVWDAHMDPALIRQWLQERVAAACRVRPDLADPATAYLARRLDAADHGRLRVVVGHRDLLAVFD